MQDESVPSLRAWMEERFQPLLPYLQHHQNKVVRESVQIELSRQTAGVNLVASESMPDVDIMLASAAIGYTQTVEGRPGKRWYPHMDGIDRVESEAERLAIDIFSLPVANVQPYTATQANQAVYFTTLNPGDTVLAPSFIAGGHLSHGAPASLAGRLYKIETYGPQKFSDEIDLQELEDKIIKMRPRLIIAGCSAYPRVVPFKNIVSLGKKHGIPVLADIAHTAGFVAAHVHPDVHEADFCTLSLHKTMCGPRGGIVLAQKQYEREIHRSVFPGLQGAVLPGMIAAKLVCLQKAATPEFRALQKDIVKNAQSMAGVFLEEGLSLYTGGTDTHLILIGRGVGADARTDVDRLQKAGILTNANYAHGDVVGKSQMSGIRLGTTWITQLGFKSKDAANLARLFVRVLKDVDLQRLSEHRRALEELLNEVLCK